MADSGIVTLLFTDLAGSTQLFDTLGDEAADAVRRAHFRLLRESVSARGGEEVKNLGDGLMVVFPSAVDAVQCAIEMQQAMLREEHAGKDGVQARVGLHIGEPIRDESDYFGRSVIIARRLCEAAEGSQILASGLVKDLVESRGTFAFRGLGPAALKGLKDTVPAFEVEWSPTVDERVPLPGPLEAPRTTTFVGRAAERERLAAAWKAAASGHRQLILLAGEPGIGKTRLACELAQRCHADDALVLYGRCDEETLVPYQPLVEALSHYVRHAPAHRLRQILRDAGHLRRLIPQLDERLSGLPDPRVVDPETEQFHLFEAVAAMMRATATTAPVLLVIDDLHWADKPTLLVLHHLVRSLEGARLLILGTYRDIELDRQHALADILASMRREHLYERVSLPGLSRTEVGQLLEATARHEMDERGRVLADELHKETEGNPFFIEEVLRHLVETGRIYRSNGRWQSDVTHVSELGIPEGIREAISRRLSRLSDAANNVLTHGAVLGREFEFGLVREMLAGGDDTVLSPLEEALEADLVVELPKSTPTYSFKHALVRQTLYDELSLPRKQRLHARAAAAIEAVYRDTEERVPSLATHCSLAGAAVDVSKTIGYLLRAADQASRVFAWEEAAQHLQGAHELMEEVGAPREERAQVLQRLGELMYITGFDWSKGISYLESALALYEEMGELYRAGQIRSRLGMYYVTNPDMIDVDEAINHFEAARRALEGRETVAIAYVYGGLGALSIWRIEPGEAERDLALTGRGMAIAERLGNRGAWAGAAAVHGCCLSWIGRLGEGLALSDRAWGVADELNHRALAFLAAWTSASSALNSGDPSKCKMYCDRELASPRVVQAPTQRRILVGMKCLAHFHLGEVSDLRALAPEAPDNFWATPLLALASGDWRSAARDWHESSTRWMAKRNRWFGAATALWEGLARRVAGDLEGSRRALAIAIEVGREGPQVMLELVGLHHMTLLSADAGNHSEAEHHLGRMADILSRDEQWGSHHGGFSFSRGVVALAGGDFDGADEAFRRAETVLSEYGLLWQLADMYYCWGRGMRAASPETSTQRLEQALALYAQIGAGDPWKERVRAASDAALVRDA